MGCGIVRLERGDEAWYLEWSTVVDAPVTYGMTRNEMRAHLTKEGLAKLTARIDERLALADKRGTSFVDNDVHGLLAVNRAGPGESELTLDGLIDAYCIRKCAYDSEKGIL